MKLKRYIAVSLLLLIATGSFACGWWPTHSGKVWLYRIMPLDESNYEGYSTTWGSDFKLREEVDYRQENLLLWQQQTSKSINLKDIEYVVYEADNVYLKKIKDGMDSVVHQNNTFANWLVRHKRSDIIEFLTLAKTNEQIRSIMNDPWYYPVEDGYCYNALKDIQTQCMNYKKGPLLGRYALQMVRALCLLREYQECASYWDNVKTLLPDNTIKEMTELKAAAALYRVGRQDEALSIYAKYGDVGSIRVINGGTISNELEFVYERHPNSPYLEGELQKWLLYYGDEACYKDEYRLEAVLKVAHRAVNKKKSKKLAMWYYTLAALYDAKGEPRKAKTWLQRGMKYSKDPFLRDSYNFLRMYIDSQTATYDDLYEQRLFRDLKWLVHKIKKEASSEVYHKLNYDIWEEEYTDDNRDVYQHTANTFYWNDAMRRMLLKVVCPRMHKAGKYVREIQLAYMAENYLVKTDGYSGEMFAIIDRLPYKDTRDYFARIYHPKDEIDSFINNRGRTDKYYWYDILATKCLRERRYNKALVYLKQIPISFQNKMRVYDYMDKNPFGYEMETNKRDSSLAPNYKLHFAEQMAECERIMKQRRNLNERADAKIKYALGLRNSVHSCWYLTRHSSNSEDTYLRRAIPDIPYPEDSVIYRHDEYVELSERLINEAFAEYTDKESKARQLRKFLYFKKIMDKYGDTETAKDIRLHCDKWRDYAEIKKRLHEK